MRSLNRNKRKLYYALYAGDESVYDEYGNETGEIRQSYGEATEYYGNVSAATGEEAVQAFGSFTNYSRTLSVADNNCPIAENTVIWFGVNPTEPYNYIVVRKADSKNGILYALQEVTVSRL